MKIKRVVASLTFFLLVNIVFVGLMAIRFMGSISNHELDQLNRNSLHSLSITLQNSLKEKKYSEIERTLQSFAQSTSFSLIKIKDKEGKVVFEYENQFLSHQHVPKWFLNLVSLEIPEISDDIIVNWKKVGTLSLKASPAYLYLAVWEVVKVAVIFQTILFILMTCLMLLFIASRK